MGMKPLEFVQFLESWFSHHNKSGLPVGTEECLEWTKLAGIPPGSKLYFYKALDAQGYPTVWGYFCDAGGMLSCRHFYKSASEAAWRAGTGLRPGGEGWVKSAEHCPQHKSGGYIFEAMVPSTLDKALKDYYSNKKENKKLDSITFNWMSQGLWDHIAKSNKDLVDYFISQTDNSKKKITTPSGIQSLYDSARQYRQAIPQNIKDGTTFDYEEGSVALQKDLKVGLKVKGTIGGKGKAHELKKYTPLWDWINQCLNKPPQQTITDRMHEILNEKHSIHTYKLEGCYDDKSAMIEIAQTDASKNLSSVTPSGITIKANTPVCWIRSAYMLPETITSFGTYDNCPIDLAFLVQKPCDYVSQTSMDEATRLNVKTVMVKDSKNKDKLKFKPGSEQTETGRMHIVQKGGQDTYLMLALFNENTSPLLKKYKDNKGLPRFEKKYWTIPHVARDHEMLLRLTEEGVKEYLDIQSIPKKESGVERGHGKTGISRANTFNTHITNVNYEAATNLLTDIYQLFAKDKVNGVSCGGWFEGIGTKPNSLFTLCIRKILTYYLVNDPPKELMDQAGTKKMKDFPGPANGITRALVKAIQLQTKKKDDETTEAFLTRHSSELLDALRS